MSSAELDRAATERRCAGLTRDRVGVMVPAGMTSNGKLLEVEELLPGIPNEVTLRSILSKLSWRAFYALSSVSRVWQRAIQSHQVYEARVRSQLAETLLVVTPTYNVPIMPYTLQMYLYSFREKRSFKLPPIPGHPRGFPHPCQCISSDGKLYVLGEPVQGSVREPRVVGEPVQFRVFEPRVVIQDLYMLDIGGARKWKQCASMLTPRRNYGCGVLHGKIYVFGGFSGRYKSAKGSEVYDPEVDAWFPIKPIPSMRYRHQVATIGEELFVYNGIFIPELSGIGNGDDMMDIEIATHYTRAEALFLEVYCPVTDEWRQIKPFLGTETGIETDGVFVVRGKFHLINELGIHVYDMNSNSWTFLQSCSYPGRGLNPPFLGSPFMTVAMDNEVLLTLRARGCIGGPSFLIRSNGVGSEGKVVVWEEVEMIARQDVAMTPIQI